MATLYNRATVSQRRVLRIVEGAIRNASEAHPEWAVAEKMARSIAKRAAGTLTADWPDVLAARETRRSGRIGGDRSNRRPGYAQTTKRSQRGAPRFLGRRSPLRSPLRAAWTLLSIEIGAAKRAGDVSKMAALVTAIRIIAAVEAVTPTGR